ncbi:MAG: hypothetical protein ACR2NS_12345 [Gemmatimonadaceae bacterium]
MKDANHFDEEDRARFEQVRNSIAARLKKSCTHLPPEEFASLVEKMTVVQTGKQKP